MNSLDQAQQLVDDPLLVWMLPVYLLALLLELTFNQVRSKGWYRKDDTLASLLMLVASAMVEALPKLVAVVLMLELQALSPWADVVQRQWWAWVLLFVLDDFSYYWFHRSNHEIRLLWAGHVNHHSSQHLNFATALRQGVGERVHKYAFWLWLPLLGFDVVMILSMISFNLFYQFWVHTPAVGRLPRLIEWIFNTPSHHRVHHASNPQYLDRNHGGVLILWDRLFGTFAQECEQDPPRYGLTKDLPDQHPWTVLSYEYRNLVKDLRRAPNVAVALRYLFYAPGWSHDGPDLRATTQRQHKTERAA